MTDQICEKVVDTYLLYNCKTLISIKLKKKMFDKAVNTCLLMLDVSDYNKAQKIY